MDELGDDDGFMDESSSEEPKKETKPKNIVDKVKEKLTPDLIKKLIMGVVGILLVLAIIFIVLPLLFPPKQVIDTDKVINPEEFLVEGLSVLLDKKPTNEEGKVIPGRIFITTDVGIIYERNNTKFLAELTQRRDQLYDKISYILSIQDPSDLNTSTERRQLENQLKDVLNEIISNEGDIKRVYFSQFRLNKIDQ